MSNIPYKISDEIESQVKMNPMLDSGCKIIDLGSISNAIETDNSEDIVILDDSFLEYVQSICDNHKSNHSFELSIDGNGREVFNGCGILTRKPQHKRQNKRKHKKLCKKLSPLGVSMYISKARDEPNCFDFTLQIS